MIPPFAENGYLPPGIHHAAFEEIAARFGSGSEHREVQIESLRWLISLCSTACISRIIINGSFVTDRLEPNDVDCVLLQGPGYNPDSLQAAELRQGLPFLEIKVVEQEDFDLFVNVLFASDRDMIAKRVVEVHL